MPRTTPPVLSPRKLPVQERSAQLVADVLEAAIRILQREGAQRFTTIRVAEEAGVSVGSLYQYFPNKQSILFRLQSDEWRDTGAMLDSLLADASKPPRRRLRDATRAFFRSECDEAPLRSALDDAAPAYRDAPASRAQRKRSRESVGAFLAAAAPRSNARQRAFAVDLMFTMLSAMGKQISERRLSRRRVDAWADVVADMLVDYLAQLSSSRRI